MQPHTTLEISRVLYMCDVACVGGFTLTFQVELSISVPSLAAVILGQLSVQGHNQIFSDRKMGVYLSESGYPTSNIYSRIRITHPGPGIIL